MPYEVRTAVFEGPFDLLLHLIARHEVDVYEVSLSGIVDEYLETLDRLGPLDLDLATEFLVIAATLVELKSRWLLPATAAPDEEADLALLEERDLLVARLVECATFRGAGEALARLAASASLSHPRTAGPEERFLALCPDLLAGVAPADLAAALARATAPRRPPRVDLGHVAPLRVSVADAVDELLVRLPSSGTMSFRQLTAGCSDRIQVVVRFLAVLELYKQGLVELEQAANFGRLDVCWAGGREVVSGPGEVTVSVAASRVDAYDG